MRTGRNRRVPEAATRLLSLQRSIYRSLELETDRLLGETPASIVRYRKSLDRQFAKVKPKAVSKDVLLRAARAAEAVLVADYHTYAQAQRTALRLLRELWRPGERWALGLELIPSRFQRALDRYAEGRISVDELHREMNYDDEWGFPWENYEPLIDFARVRGIRLLALNRPKTLFRSSASLRSAREDGELHARDQWAAGVLTDWYADGLRKEGRMGKALVLYGELHLAREHIPRQLEKVSRAFFSGAPFRRPGARCVVVHQNHDGLYWQIAARSSSTAPPPVVRLGPEEFCVFSGTPWGKLQSLVSWAEGDVVPLHDEDDADDVDHLSGLGRAAASLSSFLEIPAPNLGAVTVHTAEDADFLAGARRTGSLDPAELALAEKLLSENQRFFLPRENVAFLASPSDNALNELAASILFRNRTRHPTFGCRDATGLLSLLLEQTFAYFASLLLNPKRKCDLPADHQARIRALSRGAHPEFPGEAEARRSALNLAGERGRELGGRRGLGAGASAQRQYVLWRACRWAGALLATRLQRALGEGKTTPTELKGVLLGRLLPETADLALATRRLAALEIAARAERREESKRELI